MDEMNEINELVKTARRVSKEILTDLNKKNLNHAEVLMSLIIATASVAVVEREDRTLEEKIKSDCKLLQHLMQEFNSIHEKLKVNGST